MQELVIGILLTAVVIMAAVLLIFIGCRKDGMTKKQRIMMIRILITAGILLALQFVSAEIFDAAWDIYSRLQEGGFVLRAIWQIT